MAQIMHTQTSDFPRVRQKCFTFKLPNSKISWSGRPSK